MKTSKTMITMVEKAAGITLVPAKSKKSDKKVVIRFSVDSAQPLLKVV